MEQLKPTIDQILKETHREILGFWMIKQGLEIFPEKKGVNDKEYKNAS